MINTWDSASQFLSSLKRKTVKVLVWQRGKKPFLGRIGIAEIVYQTFKKFLSVVATDSAVCNRGMPHISCNVPGYSMT